MIDVDTERGVKLGERSALQRSAQTREVPGSDPQLVRPALAGELCIQGRRQRRLVGDDEAVRVGGKRREAAEDPGYARDHRETVDRQGDLPARPGGGGSTRVGEHRDRVRVGWLRRPEHAGCSARVEADHRDGTTRPGRGRCAYPTPGTERYAQQRSSAGWQREQRPERNARVRLSGGSRVLAVLMTVRNRDAGRFV